MILTLLTSKPTRFDEIKRGLEGITHAVGGMGPRANDQERAKSSERQKHVDVNRFPHVTENEDDDRPSFSRHSAERHSRCIAGLGLFQIIGKPLRRAGDERFEMVCDDRKIASPNLRLN
jgi:hypothetical protein